MYNDNQNNYSAAYLTGSSGDDSWDDESGNQTYDGGEGFDYVAYSGSISDYSFYQMDDGGIAVTSYDGSTDFHYGMEGLWFNDENAGYSMDQALQWANDNSNGGGDDGYGGGDDGSGGGDGYYTGTEGDDSWDDESGNQTYDGGEGFDYVAYSGSISDYSFYQMDDGGIAVTSYDGSTDFHYGMEGLWFNDENAGYSMDQALQWANDNSNGGGDDGYGGGDDGSGGGDGYYTGTEGDDSWDDESGNQTYDGGEGFDYVAYSGSISDYSFYQMDDGGIAVTSYDGSTDFHYGMEGLWFNDENAGYSMDQALQWANDNSNGGGDDGYGGGDDGSGGGDGYYTGTEGDDSWDDESGNQTYDGGEGFDYVAYSGSISDYSFYQMDDGGIAVTSYDGSTDFHYGMEGLWFNDENAGYSMDQALQWANDNSNGGGDDGYGGGDDGSGGGDGYYTGTEGDDSWDDESGNQTYDGGEGFDYVAYSGSISDYSFYQMDDGGIAVTSYDGSTDFHYGMEGLWFNDENAGYSMDQALQWANDNSNGGGDDGYGGGDDGSGGGDGYYTGTEGDDSWDDESGNQTYDGGEGFDYVAYSGSISDYSFYQMDDGGIAVTSYDGSTDFHYGMEGLWFNDENAGYSMDQALQWANDNSNGGGDDGYGGGDDGSGGGDGYYTGTEGDDSWDDESGNQTYDGGEGFDYVAYSGSISDYSFYQMDDGGIAVTSYDGSTDFHYGMEGLWFNDENAGYSMDQALQWANDNSNGGGDDGYGGGDDGSGGGDGYYTGTEGDDSWDDESGNQTYDGGEGFDYVAYSGSISDYSFYQMDDGGIAVTSYDGSTDFHYGMEGLWFNDENAGYSMDQALQWANDNSNGGGDDGYGGGDDGSGGGDGYYTGTEGDDSWDDESGNQTYDGGEGYDQVDYSGWISDYSMTRLEDDGIKMTHSDGSMDVLYGIDGLWFKDEQAWYSMDDAWQWIGEEPTDNGGGNDGYGDDSGGDDHNNHNGDHNHDHGQDHHHGDYDYDHDHDSGGYDDNYGDDSSGDGYGDDEPPMDPPVEPPVEVNSEVVLGTEGNDVIDNDEGTQYVYGLAGEDSFVIDGNLEDFGVARVDDGGVVIWQGSEFDIVYGVEEIVFNNGGYTIPETGDPIKNRDDEVIFGTDEDDVFHNAEGTQYFLGKDGNDTVVFDGNSSDYQIASTIDEDSENGFVIWTESGDFDIVYDIEFIEFTEDNETIELG